MNFAQFKTSFQDRPFILSRDVVRDSPKKQALLNQMGRWKKKGLLVALKKGLYILNNADRKIALDKNMAANILYSPSYVSLESALSLYGLIPEKVTDVTSISTLKTMRFKNELGTFTYQHVSPDAFRGFKRIGSEDRAFFIAEPEKAVVDFLYLNLGRFGGNVREVLKDSYRFQNIDELNSGRLIELGKTFNNKKLTRVITELCAWKEGMEHD